MNTVYTIHISLADIVSTLPGIMVFVSVLLAGSEWWIKRQWAWGLGLATQLTLTLFGWLTHHYGFVTNIVAAGAFGYNFYRGFYPRTAKPQITAHHYYERAEGGPVVGPRRKEGASD